MPIWTPPPEDEEDKALNATLVDDHGPAASPEEVRAAQAAYEAERPQEVPWLRANGFEDPNAAATDPAALTPAVAATPAAAAVPTPTPAPTSPSPFTTEYDSGYGKPDANMMRLAGSVPAPPPAKERDDGMLIAAGVLDLLLNKGRNASGILSTLATPKDTAYENYERQMKHAKGMADVYAYGNRGRGGRYTDPQVLELRRLQYEARLDDIDIKKQEAARKQRQWDAVNKPHTPEAEALIEYGVANGMDREKIKDLPVTTLLRVGGAPMAEYAKKTGIIGDAAVEYAGQVSREQAEQTMQPKIQTAAGISDATFENKRKLAEVQAGFRKEGEEREHARELGKESRGFAERFATKNQMEMDVAGLINTVQSSPGGVAPATFPERFRGAITAYVIGDDRIESWQAKHMILEIWSRSQSGAAISESEDGKFIMQVGLDPKASAENIEAAFKVLSSVVDGRIKAAASPNPAGAAPVLKARNLDPAKYLQGMEGVQVQPAATPGGAPTPAAPAPAPPAGAPTTPTAAPQSPQSAAPAPMRNGKQIAMRNGKAAVKPIKVQGKPGRMIFYEDGTREVVFNDGTSVEVQ